MAKLVDIVRVLSEQINHPELGAAVMASNPLEVEFDDEKFKEIESQTRSLMTLDKAINSPEVIDKLKPTLEADLKKKFKSDSLFAVEKQLEEFGKKVGIDLDHKKQHEEQLKILNENIENLKGDVDISSFQKEISGLRSQLGEKDNLLNEAQEKYKSDMENFKVESLLRNKLSSYSLQDAYQKDKVKNGLFNSIISEVNSEATLKLGQDSNLQVFQKENPEMKIFGDNNKEIGIDDLIGSKIKDFIKVSDSKPEPKEPVTPSADVKQNLTGSSAGTMQSLRQSGVTLA